MLFKIHHGSSSFHTNTPSPWHAHILHSLCSCSLSPTSSNHSISCHLLVAGVLVHSALLYLCHSFSFEVSASCLLLFSFLPSLKPCLLSINCSHMCMGSFFYLHEDQMSLLELPFYKICNNKN